MTKQQFIDALKKRLSGLPEVEIEERLNFYSEMIDDRIEEGCDEEEAVLCVGSVEKIAAQIIVEAPLVKNEKEKAKPQKRLKAWEIVLMALGSPIWISLAVAAFSVILALYVTMWAVIASLWAVFASLCGGALCGVVVGVLFTITANGLVGAAMFAAGLVCGGLAIFMFFACLASTKAVAHIIPKIISGIKKRFVKKEESHNE